jgi:hypothetical protein
LLFGAAHLLGERIALRLGLELQGFAERVAIRGALGLGVLGLAGMLLAAFGRLRPFAILGLLVLPVALGLAWRPRLPRGGGPEIASNGRPLLAYVALAALAVLALANGVRALFPPTGFDALNYQLPAVSRYLEEGRLGFPADLRFAAGPALVPVLFTLAAANGGELSCQLVSFGTGLLLAAACAALASRFWGGTAGALAGLIAYAIPVVGWLSAEAYVDLAFALFMTVALLGVSVWLRGGGHGWVVLAGGAIGFGLGVRYLAAVPLLLLCADLTTAPVAIQGVKRRLAGAALFLLTAVAVAFPWYLRNQRATGNPFYPLWNQAFAGRYWSPEDEAEHDRYLREVGPGRGLTDLALAPWRLAFTPSAFGASTATSTGFAFVLLLPLLAWVRPPGPGTVLLGVHAGALYGAWFYTSQQTRFALPALAVAASLLGGALATLGSSPTGRFRHTRVAAVVVALAVAVAGGTRWPDAPPPLGAAARAEYLRARVSGYAVIEEVNRRLPKGAVLYAFGEEGHRYYYQARTLGDWFGPAAYRRFIPHRDDREVWSGWRRLGVTHVLLRDDLPARAARAFLERPFWWERLVPLGAWGGVRLYQLVDPEPPAEAAPIALG